MLELATFMFIPADVTPANKPQHLERRFNRAPKSPGLAGASQRRTQLLQARREKLRLRAQRIQKAVGALQAASSASQTAHLEQLQATLSIAWEKRQRILQEQSDQCASHVQRAKQMAAARHIDDHQQALTRKHKLEQRFREVAHRREKIMAEKLELYESLYKPRSSLEVAEGNGPTSSSKTLQQGSAKRIQKWYRAKRWSKLIHAYRPHHLSFAEGASMAFPVLVQRIQKKNVIMSTSRLLQNLFKSSWTRMEYKNPARVFLTAYIIYPNAEEILEGSGPKELALKEMSRQVMVAFDAFIQTQSYANLQTFLDAWRTYYSLFQAWKSKDTNHLMEDLLNHYIDLERLWYSVRHDPTGEEEWKPHVSVYQEQVMQKIKDIGGKEAVELLEAKLKECREKWEVEKPKFSRAMAMPTNVVSAETQQSKPKQDSVTEQPKQRSDVHVATPEPEHLPKDASDRKASLKNTTTPHDQLPSMVQTNSMTNQQLAHELILNPEFKLEASKRSEAEQHIKAIAQRAFLDYLREQLEQKVYHTWFPTLIKEVKEGLKQMLSPRVARYKQINEVLDVEHIHQQCLKGGVDVFGYFDFIVDQMQAMCAPVRDPAIGALKERLATRDASELGDIFTSVHEVLDGMHLDLANFKLATLRPQLIQQAVSYERTKFQELLDQGMTLANTEKWLQDAVEHLEERPTMGDMRYEEIYNAGLLRLLMGSKAISMDTLPETLHLDGKRLFDLQNELQRVTLVAVLVLLTKNTLELRLRDHVDFDKLAKELFVLMDSNADPTGHHLRDHIVRHVTTSLPALPSTTTETLTALLDKLLASPFTFPLFSVMTRRLTALLRSHLTTGQLKKEQMKAHGLEGVEEQLDLVSRKICLLAKHNKEVHSQWYDAIIKKLMAEKKDAE